MSKDKEQKKSRFAQLQEGQGVFSGLSKTFRLVLRLMGDSRVNFFLKLLPVGTLVYLISPLDAAIPVVDDALIVGIGTYVFIELCPPDVVEEHRARLDGLEDRSAARQDSSVVDAAFTEEKDE
jgi:hypothetical protein